MNCYRGLNCAELVHLVTVFVRIKGYLVLGASMVALLMRFKIGFKMATI